MNTSSIPPSEQLEDLLAAAAFGTLSESELRELDALIRDNPEARAELASLQSLAADLSYLADERAPSTDLRDRLERAITAEADPQAPPSAPAGTIPFPTPVTSASTDVALDHPAAPKTDTAPKSGTMLTLRPYLWAAAAALVLALVSGILIDRFVLTNDDSGMQEIAFDLTMPVEVPDLTAELLYDPDEQIFMLKMDNMPSAPEGQVYQIWLIDHDGVPQPEGVMDRPVFSVAANREDFAAFAITTEPGPLGSEGPTSDPFFVAPLN